MNWNDIPVFLAIAQGGSLNAAARTLGLNHSTVFRRLNALEEELSTRLFERLPTGYALTGAGERMLEKAQQADVAIQELELAVAGRDRKASGLVRLTTAPNIARTIVPAVVGALRKEHPGIVVEVAVGDSDYNLNRREADLALRATSKPPEHLIGRKVMELSWWVCGGSRGRSRPPANPVDLRKKPMIGADRALMRLPAFQWLEEHCAESIVARANDLSTMAALAIAGVGYAVLPSDQQESGIRRLFPVPNLSGELWLLSHPDLRKVRRVAVVWDALIAATAAQTKPQHQTN